MPSATSPLDDAKIPIVDLGSVNAAEELLDAAVEYGFIFVKHDETLPLKPQDVDDMFSLSKDFFAAPDEVKGEALVKQNRGWVPMHREALNPGKGKKGDYKEGFNFGEFVDGKAQQPLPGPLKTRETQIGDFADRCHLTCDLILKLLAQGLKISPSEGGENWFSMRHDKTKGQTSSIFRMLRYPVLPDAVTNAAGEDIRAGAHSDYGSITLLFRLPGQPGLEIMTPSGAWATVPVDPEPESPSNVMPILVNIGDLLSYWTNGLLKSTVHRVIFPRPEDGAHGQQDRYSIAFFCQPEDDAKLVEIPSEVVKKHGQRSNGVKPTFDSVMTAKDHLNSRLAATYGGLT